MAAQKCSVKPTNPSGRSWDIVLSTGLTGGTQKLPREFQKLMSKELEELAAVVNQKLEFAKNDDERREFIRALNVCHYCGRYGEGLCYCMMDD